VAVDDIERQAGLPKMLRIADDRAKPGSVSMATVMTRLMKETAELVRGQREIERSRKAGPILYPRPLALCFFVLYIFADSMSR